MEANAIRCCIKKWLSQCSCHLFLCSKSDKLHNMNSRQVGVCYLFPTNSGTKITVEHFKRIVQRTGKKAVAFFYLAVQPFITCITKIVTHILDTRSIMADDFFPHITLLVKSHTGPHAKTYLPIDTLVHLFSHSKSRWRNPNWKIFEWL